MASATQDIFESIRIVGGLLSTKVLLDARQYTLPGQNKPHYGIEASLSFNDEIGRYWLIARNRWREFRQQSQREDLDNSDVTVNEWLVPLLTKVLGYTVETCYQKKLIGEREFPISHEAYNGAVPIVLCDSDKELDKSDPSFGQEGRKRSPMGLAQEYLNAQDASLWSIVSNGKVLRLLRDNPAMTRPAYLEVDFAHLFDEDNYADFATLWLLLHASRLEPRENVPEQCWIEQWREKGHDEGERALYKLRYGVADALRQLGTGFLTHPSNTELRRKLSSTELSTDAYFQQVLRLVYRFLFLLTAEDRDIALLPANHGGHDYRAARKLYQQGYSVNVLRERARQRRHYDHHNDAWELLSITFDGFAKGQPLLAQPALGGLFTGDHCVDLKSSQIENHYIYSALFNLCYFDHQGILARINYRDMDTEEFGSVYESLLELIPQIHTEGKWRFSFIGDAEDETAASGHSRKLSGSYYTPDSLVQELIKSALEPVIEDRLKANPQSPRQAILDISVCDPACGSGHFLLAAARRLAKELAQIDAGSDQATEEHYRHAMHDVVRRCIYGVDFNPLAVELCKTGLWLESIEPGKPMSFLDAHIQNGNSLLGITDLNQISLGIPKEAFKALSGDDNQFCKILAKTNAQYLKAFRSEDNHQVLSLSLETSSTFDELKQLEELPEETVEQISAKKTAFTEYRSHLSDSRLKQAVDLYMAAFLAPKDGSVPAQEIPDSQNLYLALYTDQATEQLEHVSQQAKIRRAQEICRSSKVFNWPLAFPQLLSGPSKGFDCILGNPPWERIKLQEQEFFSSRSTDITDAKNKSERSQRIDWLSQGLLAHHLYPEHTYSHDASAAEKRLYQEFIKTKRTSEALSVFAHVKDKDAGRYPLTGVGDVNTYALFSETIHQILSPRGRAGFIVPSGLATDNSTKDFFGELISKRSLFSFFEFENEGFFKGAGQGHMLRFALTTLLGKDLSAIETSFMFQGKKVSDLKDRERVFNLSAEDIERVNPNTLTCPIFQSRYDAELTKKIYKKISVLIRESRDARSEENPWGVSFTRMFDMSNDSHLFKTREELIDQNFNIQGNIFKDEDSEFLPLYESKMINIFNNRYGDFSYSSHERAHVLPKVSIEDWKKINYVTSPFYWVDKKEVERRLKSFEWKRDWLFVWRRITDSRASARTLISCAIPKSAVGDSLFIPLLSSSIDNRKCGCFLGNMGSIVLDYVARQKLGGLNMSYFTFKQLPFLRTDDYSEACLAFITPRIAMLSCNSVDMQAFAADLGHDLVEYDDNARAVAQAELDAYFAQLYGLTREELQFILDPQSVKSGYPSETFAVLKRNEERQFGEYRTQRLVLEAWDKIERGEIE